MKEEVKDKIDTYILGLRHQSKLPLIRHDGEIITFDLYNNVNLSDWNSIIQQLIEDLEE